MPVIQPASSSRTISKPFGAAWASNSATFSIVTSCCRSRGACGSRGAITTGGRGAEMPHFPASRRSFRHLSRVTLASSTLACQPKRWSGSRPAFGARSPAGCRTSGSQRPGSCHCRCRRRHQARDAVAQPIRGLPAPSGRARSAPRLRRAAALQQSGGHAAASAPVAIQSAQAGPKANIGSLGGGHRPSRRTARSGSGQV